VRYLVWSVSAQKPAESSRNYLGVIVGYGSSRIYVGDIRSSSYPGVALPTNAESVGDRYDNTAFCAPVC
jgi:hypothetical protein